jgi:ABC-type phosphate/phosphonate transport system substrate-binding protein
MPDMNAASKGFGKNESSAVEPSILFMLDTNLGLPTDEMPWVEILPAMGIKAVSTTDLPKLDKSMEAHEPDVAFMPIADFHRMIGKGDRHYKGFAIATSKFTGTTNLPSVLVVRKDDNASSLDDLEGSTYGYINKSCSSSYFPPFILIERKGKRGDEFFKMQQVPAWQGQIDAVVNKTVRATMVPEDVWKTTPENAQTTKVIGRYDEATAALVVARDGLDEKVAKPLLDALVAWEPKWEAVYGAFRPFYYADVQHFFHDLNKLPPGI